MLVIGIATAGLDTESWVQTLWIPDFSRQLLQFFIFQVFPPAKIPPKISNYHQTRLLSKVCRTTTPATLVLALGPAPPLALRFIWKDHETAKMYEDRYIFWASKTLRDDFLLFCLSKSWTITKFSEMPSVPSESMFSPHIIFTSFLSLCMAHMAPESVVLRELMTNPICLIKNLIGSRGIPSGSSPAVHSEVIHGELVILVYQFGVSLTWVPSSNTKLASKCT